MRQINHILCCLILLFIVCQQLSAQTIVPYRNQNGWSYYDVDKKKFVKQKLEEVKPVVRGVAFARETAKWGAYDLKMKTVIPFEYDELTWLTDELISARKGTSFWVYKTDGNLLAKDAMKEVACDSDHPNVLLFANSSGLFGLMNLQGEILVKAEHVVPPDFLGESFISFTKAAGSGFKTGIYDMSGKLLVDYDYETVKRSGYEHFGCYDENGDGALYDITGKQIQKIQLDEYPYVVNELVIGKYQGKSSLYRYGEEEVIETFDRLLFPRNGGAHIGVNGKEVSIITPSGNVVKLDSSIQAYPYNNGFVAVFKEEITANNQRKKTFALLDQEGKKVIDFKYAAIASWNNDLAACVKHDRTTGLINFRTGAEVLPFEYEQIVILETGYFLAKKKGKPFVIYDSNLNVVDGPTFDRINHVRGMDSLLVVESHYENGKRRRERRVGVITTTGRIVFDLKYRSVTRLPNRYSKNPLHGKYLLEISEDNRRHYAVYSAAGDSLIPFKKYNRIYYYDGNYIKVHGVKESNGIHRNFEGLCDTLGNEILSLQFEKIQDIQETGIVVLNNGRVGFVSPQGRVLLPCEYHSVNLLSNGYAVFEKWEKFGLVDSEGEIKIQPKYSKIEFSENDFGLALVELDGKQFYVDMNGNELKDEK